MKFLFKKNNNKQKQNYLTYLSLKDPMLHTTLMCSRLMYSYELWLLYLQRNFLCYLRFSAFYNVKPQGFSRAVRIICVVKIFCFVRIFSRRWFSCDKLSLTVALMLDCCEVMAMGLIWSFSRNGSGNMQNFTWYEAALHVIRTTCVLLQSYRQYG